MIERSSGLATSTKSRRQKNQTRITKKKPKITSKKHSKMPKFMKYTRTRIDKELLKGHLYLPFVDH